jgi:hypothetical protein
MEAIRQGDIPGVQLRRRQALPVAAEEAWGWLVEPLRQVRWLAAAARVEGEGRGALLWLDGTVEEGASAGAWRERGRTLEITPPRRWVVAWERLDAGWPVATRVVLELHPCAGGCELDVLHQGFERLPLSSCLTVWEAYRHRWRTALERLAFAVSSP